jgi:hypothetical protein
MTFPLPSQDLDFYIVWLFEYISLKKQYFVLKFGDINAVLSNASAKS